MLAADATFTMPPLPTWYRGHDAIAAFLTRYRAPGSLAPAPGARQRAAGLRLLRLGCRARQRYTALSLDVLTLDGTRTTEVTSFVTPYTRGPARDRFAADVFARVGLPGQVD